MSGKPEPLAVYDTRDGKTWPPSDLEPFLGWVRDHGIGPSDTYRIEIFRGFARVFQYVRNERGRHYCPFDHDHLDDPDRCEPARRDPFDVPISSMPPARPFARERR